MYTINRCPSLVVLNKTPYERFFGTAPDYSLLKVFGYVCFVLFQPHEHTKLQPRSQLCCFLGYGLEEKGYRCYDPVAKRLRVSRNVVIWEHKMFHSIPSFSEGCRHPILYLLDTPFCTYQNPESLVSMPILSCLHNLASNNEPEKKVWKGPQAQNQSPNLNLEGICIFQVAYASSKMHTLLQQAPLKAKHLKEAYAGFTLKRRTNQLKQRTPL